MGLTSILYQNQLPLFLCSEGGCKSTENSGACTNIVILFNERTNLKDEILYAIYLQGFQEQQSSARLPLKPSLNNNFQYFAFSN